MSAHCTVQTRSRRRNAIAQIDLICIAVASVALLVLLSALTTAADSRKKRTVCSANLRGMGQGMFIYANDNHEWFPAHYFSRSDTKQPDSVPADHGVNWVGTMGSNEPLKVSEPTTPERAAAKSHLSRSLFLLVIDGTCTPKQFICPSTDDKEDALRNYGPDAGDAAEKESGVAAQPGVTRFDFLGYDSLSYGYQLPYGRKARPNLNLDPRMVFAADKGPYYESGGEGIAGTKTTRDKRSAINAPDWTGKSVDELAALGKKWAPFNSRNHASEGQNALYVDGHVDFAKTPVVGVNRDNIFTIQSSLTDSIATLLGTVPSAEQAYGPSTQSDSFIVP